MHIADDRIYMAAFIAVLAVACLIGGGGGLRAAQVSAQWRFDARCSTPICAS